MTTTTRTLRNPTPDDAAAVLAVVMADDLHELGRVDVDESDVAGWWGEPQLDPSTDAWLLEADGTAVGYGQTTDGSGIGRFESDAWVVDEGDRDGYGLLMAAIAERARELTAAHGRTQCLLVTWSVMGREQRADWLTGLGFEKVRRFYRMEIDLDDGARVAPEPAAGVTIERVGAHEETQRAYQRLMSASFADHWGHVALDFDTWLGRVSASPNFDWNTIFLVRVDGVPAAGMKMRMHADLAWVDTLGTSADHRGRGLASLLLRTAFAEALARGQSHLELGVDTENATGAVGLYERVGMSVAFAHDEWRKSLD